MKIIRLKHIGTTILFSTLIISTFLIPSMQVIDFTLSNNEIRLKSSATGVSNYSITSYVNYDVEINFSITQNDENGTWYFKYPRLNDRQPESPLTEYTPPYQVSELLYNSISHPSTMVRDEFNNTYDLYNGTIFEGETITLSQHYNITLNKINFENIEYLDIEMSDYNLADPMFTLYGNNTMLYYNTSDPELVTLSNSITAGYTNPAMKAKRIIQWVASNINYPDTPMPAQEIGASAAYDNREGDCSEFSSLAVTLMRIQGIPARKVSGLLVTSNTDFQPAPGYTKTFTVDESTSNFGGHAWIEYYIPTIGWVSCEPQRADLWKTSSYLTFTQNIGQWFTFPDYYGNPENISEFNGLYSGTSYGDFDFLYTFKLTVIDSYFPPGLDWFTIIIIASIIGVVAVVSIVIIRTIIVKKRNKNAW
ncbi:MAG: transglutaminase family protein [Promethearchaeota archaeon]